MEKDLQVSGGFSHWVLILRHFHIRSVKKLIWKKGCRIEGGYQCIIIKKYRLHQNPNFQHSGFKYFFSSRDDINNFLKHTKNLRHYIPVYWCHNNLTYIVYPKYVWAGEFWGFIHSLFKVKWHSIDLAEYRFFMKSSCPHIFTLFHQCR